jgi:hypothetical protein
LSEEAWTNIITELKTKHGIEGVEALHETEIVQYPGYQSDLVTTAHVRFHKKVTEE